VRFQRLGYPAKTARLDHPDSLLVYPRDRALDFDVVLARFEPESLASEIPIQGLGFQALVEEHGASGTMVQERSTLLGGEVEVRATGGRRSLKQGEALRFADVRGSLTGLLLDETGVRVGFRGRVAGLEWAAPGLAAESLMPSVLDLALGAGAQRVMQGAAGALAALVLLLSVLPGKPHRRLRPSRPGGQKPLANS
jgi:hypothetical protein